VIDTIDLAEAPPLIELLEPLGVVELRRGDLLPIRWRLAGAARTVAAGQGVSIGISYDGGQTFMPRAHRVQGNAYILDARSLAAPVTVTVEVLALQNGMSGSARSAPDSDQDGCPDPIDPAPVVPDTVDTDGDGVPDVCDRCPGVADPLQTDTDDDGAGDACDADYNNDGRVDDDDFRRGFQPCLGADVVARPECFDRDRNRDGTVAAADFCVGNPCDDGDPCNGSETCSAETGCLPGLPVCSPTPTQLPIPSPTPVVCTGDCDRNAAVTIAELIQAVRVALNGCNP